MGKSRAGDSGWKYRALGPWVRGVQHELTRRNLIDLASGRVPAIRIPSFIDEETAGALRALCGSLVPGHYENVVPPIKKHGPTVFEHAFADRERYFYAARAMNERMSAACVDSPIERFRQRLQRCGWSTDLAVDQTHGPYFAGLLRSIEEGTPVHIDFAPHESPGWEMVSTVEAQLSANVYLDAPGETGRLIIYEKPWVPEDERHRFADRFGYGSAVVEGANLQVVEPTERSLVLFNPRFFHRVEASGHPRRTFSFFFAIRGENAILWS